MVFVQAEEMKAPDPCFRDITLAALWKKDCCGEVNGKQREKLEGYFHSEDII